MTCSFCKDQWRLKRIPLNSLLQISGNSVRTANFPRISPFLAGVRRTVDICFSWEKNTFLSGSSLVKPKNRRFRVIADLKLQGLLCLRVAVYWLICQSTIVLTILGFQLLGGASSDAAAEGTPWHYFVPAITVSICVLPIMLLDLVLFSNRFAGPMMRTRRQLREMAAGAQVSDLHFRRNDYYEDLSHNLNVLRNQICEKELSEESEMQQPSVANRLGPPELQTTH